MNQRRCILFGLFLYVTKGFDGVKPNRHNNSKQVAEAPFDDADANANELNDKIKMTETKRFLIYYDCDYRFRSSSQVVYYYFLSQVTSAYYRYK